MAQKMPCGMYIRRKAEDNFIRQYPTPVSYGATEWLATVEHNNNIQIEHARNGPEFRVNKIPVDGYCRYYLILLHNMQVIHNNITSLI